MKTILEGERGKSECFICSLEYPLERHEAYFGRKNRQISIDNGFVVMLCPQCHRGDKSAHKDRNIDLHIKKHFQRLYELDNSREDWMRLIGRNYL